MWLFVLFVSVLALRWIRDLAYPAFRPMAAGIGSSPHTTLNWIKVGIDNGWMDGWMEYLARHAL